LSGARGTVELTCGTCGKVLHVRLLGHGEELSHDRPDGTHCPGVQSAQFAKTDIKLEPYPMPKLGIFDLDYKYGKKP